MSDVDVQRLADIATPLVNKFYQAYGARGRASKADQVWVARADSGIIGAARLLHLSEDLLLVGVFIAPQWRQQGVARELISTVCQHQKQPVFSFIYAHLAAFYLSLGFQPEPDLPDELQQRFNAYQRQGRDILAYCLNRGNHA
ncbi:GNAT family N-acetyltransferase [Pseudoalteromonas ruthenica]|uniref:GNAT family N-acetyltransferase n=1 Tax=Pseudoalteromonas ruthenica TaxID=151081 RepID=UPI00034BCFFB|nr:GNAT family N-acetyltransferase [Pseudoalteromonas ruthenica]